MVFLVPMRAGVGCEVAVMRLRFEGKVMEQLSWG
jgi:hypothetical protein